MYEAFRKALSFFFHFLRFEQTPTTQSLPTIYTLNNFSDPKLQKNGNLKLRKKIGDLICKFQSFYEYKNSCIINDLPDEILTHILSFLPIKEAFRTSVLSKRWIPLCNSLSVLHFDDGSLLYPRNTDKRAHFCRFVDTIMFNPHSQQVTLKSLQIKFFSGLRNDEAANGVIFDKWVEAAKRRHVEDLYLFLFNVHLAPSTIFCCKTLVVLRLMYIHIANMFHCSVELPLLKTLQLYNIYFEVGEDFMKLLSGCPKLENWETTIVHRENGYRVLGYIEPLSKLINAEIILFEVPYTPLKNVKFLTVLQFGGTSLNDEMNSYYKSFPVFENLTKLQLFWCHSILHDWGEVLKMLPSCPKLQSLEIQKASTSFMEDWKYPYDVPECVSSNLTMCKIIDYEALESDFRFATYILENARLLQVMIICHTFEPKPTESPQFLEGLSSCSRISPVCTLSVSESLSFQDV